MYLLCALRQGIRRLAATCRAWRSNARIVALTITPTLSTTPSQRRRPSSACAAPSSSSAAAASRFAFTRAPSYTVRISRRCSSRNPTGRTGDIWSLLIVVPNGRSDPLPTPPSDISNSGTVKWRVRSCSSETTGIASAAGIPAADPGGLGAPDPVPGADAACGGETGGGSAGAVPARGPPPVPSALATSPAVSGPPPGRPSVFSPAPSPSMPREWRAASPRTV